MLSSLFSFDAPISMVRNDDMNCKACPTKVEFDGDVTTEAIQRRNSS